MRLLQQYDYAKMENVVRGYFIQNRYQEGLAALEFAIARHEATPPRKGNGLPYVTHPILIAYMFVLLNLPCEFVAAALLHDAPEDAHADFDVLPGGKIVQDAVRALTIMKLQPNETKAQVKQRYYGRMDGNIIALVSKMFDRITNLSSAVGALSEEAIIKNVLETYEKLLPAVKRARKRPEAEYRHQRDTLFAAQLMLDTINEAIARMFKVESVKRREYDYERTYARLLGRLEGIHDLDQADAALVLVRQLRERHDQRPIALRAIVLAAYALSIGVRDDKTIAVILLGNYEYDMRFMCSDVCRAVRRLRPVMFEGEDEADFRERVYTELSDCKEALVTKALYRWQEIADGVGVLDVGEMRELLLDTDRRLMPALVVGSKKFGAVWTMFELLQLNLRMLYETVAQYYQIDLDAKD